MSYLNDRNKPNSTFALMEILGHALEHLRNGGRPCEVLNHMESARDICHVDAKRRQAELLNFPVGLNPCCEIPLGGNDEDHS